ncbi:GNAT family N-acetyltransferase [Flavimaricola marinus]|uniref:N-acetyltransferase domain-containing protein n=1 Tax=Flavimaricola marinus TaxID=1819565 RepID=A0A238L9X5_9RHOB|nr:GNAT family N-acetyltransferase [Flavimaricola marinus]SMY06224.1 hypothetical protein LOM8899_00347 [Flavimaricola marinus]
MTRPWETPMTGALAERARAALALFPVIETERLRLRPAEIDDFGTYADIYSSPRWDHGEPFDDEDIWLDFCQLVAGWLLRGIGLMAVTDQGDDALLGFVLINHEYGDPEIELGWMLTAQAEGKGIATEAATAIRRHGEQLGLTSLVSYIGPTNTRSARVAMRMGAQRDASAEADYPGEIHVYRHPAPKVSA